MVTLVTEMSERRVVAIIWSVALGLLLLSVLVSYNNDYMTYRDYTVTYVEKDKSDSCHKSNCRIKYIGLFKTEEGVFFQQETGLYTYTQMHLGEKYVMTKRPFDVRQSSRENVLYFFLPVLLYALTFAIWLVWIGSLIVGYFTKENKETDDE